MRDASTCHSAARCTSKALFQFGCPRTSRLQFSLISFCQFRRKFVPHRVTRRTRNQAICFILAGGHVRASAGALAVHGALIPCVCACACVRYQTPFSSRHESGPGLFLPTGKHPVVGQLPRVSFSALPGQSSGRPNLPPYSSAITALFLDRSLVAVHLTGHDLIMTVEILRTMASSYCQ